MYGAQFGSFPFASNEGNFQEDEPEDMNSHIGAGDTNQGIDKTKLIVNYIPQFATEEDLGLIFARVGPVENVKIMRDFKTGYSFGFGFVKYFKEEDARKAINALNGFNFRNKRLKVSYSRPPGTDIKDSNLYITNLPKDVTEDDIENLFKDYGEIIQKTVLKDKHTGMPRGVAFVRYATGEEAKAAITNLDGKMLENAMLPLSVKVAEEHGKQKAQYLEAWNPMNFNNNVGILPAVRAAGLLPFTRPTLPSRYNRYHTSLMSPTSTPLLGAASSATVIRNLGAGDTYFQNSYYSLPFNR